VDYEKINRWLTLAANLAVIAGILFLAFELKQNNDLLRAEVRLERAKIRIDAYGQRISSDAALQAIVRSRSGEALNAAETELLESLAMQSYTRWEYVVGEYKEGRLEWESVPIEDWKRVVSENPYMETTWHRRGNKGFDPDFVKFVEKFLFAE
jgi:hypothetical protein